MRIFTNILFLLLVFSFGLSKESYPDVWDNLMNFTQWERVKVTEKYHLSKFELEGFPVPAFKIEMDLKAHPQSILDVAWNVSEYPESLPSAYITQAGIFQKQDSIQIAWQIIDIPFMVPRLYQFQHIRKRNRIDWYNTVFNQSIEDNVITAFTNVGSWRISKKGEKNILTYIVLTDPGGIVPVWSVEQAQMKYLPQMLIEAEDSALKLKKE